MNLFVSDIDPIISAKNLDDKRVKHMPKETLEMLIMSIYKHSKVVIHPFILWGDQFRREKEYELFINPVTEWVARSKINQSWTYKHLFSLFDEYKFRFGSNHYLYDLAVSFSHFFKEVDILPKSFCNATGLSGTNIIELYRECLMIKWFETDEIMPVTWTKRGMPNWCINKGVKQQELFQKNLFNIEQQWEDLPF